MADRFRAVFSGAGPLPRCKPQHQVRCPPAHLCFCVVLHAAHLHLVSRQRKPPARQVAGAISSSDALVPPRLVTARREAIRGHLKRTESLLATSPDPSGAAAPPFGYKTHAHRASKSALSRPINLLRSLHQTLAVSSPFCLCSVLTTRQTAI
ncbi:hypothetical protein CC78DRAFT_576603 [Lojkania enalia]|uniref:Uncharacterized protein n=1 Tax=Lojkania enalia TaxID=147567 RepID=A0A9P4KHC2_9PLEO|nr:hypothetical protein CC78DRAFT_576603 [Didymosphaeria enalia]